MSRVAVLTGRYRSTPAVASRAPGVHKLGKTEQDAPTRAFLSLSEPSLNVSLNVTISDSFMTPPPALPRLRDAPYSAARTSSTQAAMLRPAVSIVRWSRSHE
jgi:hypothetical protein